MAGDTMANPNEALLEKSFREFGISPGNRIAFIPPYSRKVFTGVLQADGTVIAKDGRQSSPNWARLTPKDTPVRVLGGQRNPNMKLAKEMRSRYRSDLKAGHTDAAEYWKGQSAAYFTGNPTRLPVIKRRMQQLRKQWDSATQEWRRSPASDPVRDELQELRKQAERIVPPRPAPPEGFHWYPYEGRLEGAVYGMYVDPSPELPIRLWGAVVPDTMWGKLGWEWSSYGGGVMDKARHEWISGAKLLGPSGVEAKKRFDQWLKRVKRQVVPADSNEEREGNPYTLPSYTVFYMDKQGNGHQGAAFNRKADALGTAKEASKSSHWARVYVYHGSPYESGQAEFVAAFIGGKKANEEEIIASIGGRKGNPHPPTTREVWEKAAASIAPTDPIRPGFAHALHPKMIKALGKFGWEEAAVRETDIRRRWLARWEARRTKGNPDSLVECEGIGETPVWRTDRGMGKCPRCGRAVKLGATGKIGSHKLRGKRAFWYGKRPNPDSSWPATWNGLYLKKSGDDFAIYSEETPDNLKAFYQEIHIDKAQSTVNQQVFWRVLHVSGNRMGPRSEQETRAAIGGAKYYPSREDVLSGKEPLSDRRVKQLATRKRKNPDLSCPSCKGPLPASLNPGTYSCNGCGAQLKVEQ